MKILFFTPNLARTGSEVAIYNIICNSRGQDTKMVVAVNVNGELLDQLPKDVPHLNYNQVTPPQPPPMSLVARVMRRLGRNSNDAARPTEWLADFSQKFPGYIWYVNTISQPRILKQARKFGVTCVLHSHELEQMLVALDTEDVKNLVEYPNLIIATSTAAADVLRQLGRTDNLEVLHPPVELKNITSTPEKAEAVRRKLGIKSETFVWVMSGTVDPNKNPILFLELADEMRKRELNVHFVWIGGWGHGYRLFVEKRAEFLELGNIVTWAGIRDDDYYDYLNAADGFVLTSTLESFSMVSVEAAYLGKPIVSFDSRGIREIVKPGMGVIVESRNASDLVEAMIRVMKGQVDFDPEVSRAQARLFDAPRQARQWQSTMRVYFGDSK